MYDVDLFASVINPPETAILGVGSITLKPAVLGESVTARQMMTLTLVFDHRVTDSVLAAEFLQAGRPRYGLSEPNNEIVN